MKQVVSVVSFLFLVLWLNAQTTTPTGATYYPTLVLPNTVDSTWYANSIPYIGLTRPYNDINRHAEFYIEQGIGRKYFSPTQIQGLESYGFSVVQIPSQKRIYRVNELGVLPAWESSSFADTFPDLQIWTTQYHPDLGVHTYVERRLNQSTPDLHILDSTFHPVATLRNIGDPHGCKLEKNIQGKWEITISGGVPIPYYYGKNNYVIAHFRIDTPGRRTLLWSVGPTTTTVDSAVFEGFNLCDRPNVGAQGPNDIWHENSWDYIKWSPDSLLVAVSERSVNDVVFYWLVDSSGTWVPRGIERLGNSGWRHNDFSFPQANFSLNHGHDARILYRNGDTLIMSLFDNHTCDSSDFAKAMIIQITLHGKTCTVLRSQTQHSLSYATGSCQLMNESPILSTSDSQLFHAPFCIYWGFGQNPILPDSAIGALTGYAPAGDPADHGFMETGIYNDSSQCIAGVTHSIFHYGYPEIAQNGKPVIQNYQVYQAAAYYYLPIPENSITCANNTNGTVTLTTTLDSALWTTGEHGTTITIDPHSWNAGELTRLYGVQGKTDATMVGNLFAWNEVASTGCIQTGITPILSEKITLYPNPTHDQVTFSQTVEYKLFDPQGRSLNQGVANHIGLGSYASGIYLIAIASPSHQWNTYRVSKQ